MLNVLILEDDIYLAQKVTSKLQDDGYHVNHYTSVLEVDNSRIYDTVLLSTNALVGNTEEIIKKYLESTIILLVSYVSDATVTRPLKAGASDYVLKPFSIDELIRKIKHFEEFKRLQFQNKALEDYMDFLFQSTAQTLNLPSKFPYLIETNDQKEADKIVFDLSRKMKKKIEFVSLTREFKFDFSNVKDKLIYIYDFHNIKNSSKELLLKNIKDFDVILCSLDSVEHFPYEKTTIKKEVRAAQNDTILTINEYVKLMVLNFQNNYPDTELSKKLGISRKSLWEKRKKFGIEKDKI
ncbi:MAG: response regulator [Epsilonproteobacteria bacterium]|nr:response regulator [Campylobacterota bacterium]